MDPTHDDLEAVRTICATLEPFPNDDRERILRWAREKLCLPVATGHASLSPQASLSPTSSQPRDIRSFAQSKGPTTDTQFAAVVAYYYRFEAPENIRKEAITADDLQEACRLVDRERLQYPAQTLINSRNAGLLDKADESGSYKINTVGENLVAMTLPSSESSPATQRATAKRAKPKRQSKSKNDSAKSQKTKASS